MLTIRISPIVCWLGGIGFELSMWLYTNPYYKDTLPITRSIQLYICGHKTTHLQPDRVEDKVAVNSL